jgi:MarR family transcriptional regulator, organic hydroperoxide resistance regulator
MQNYFKDMKPNVIISLISAIRTKTNEFLINQLTKEGFADIAPSHGSIMYALFKHDGISMKEISKIINKKKNTVTVLIDKLVVHGFVRKTLDTVDRRTTLIYLTQKGKNLEKPFNTISEKLLKKTYEGFTEEERCQLSALLEKLYRNF